MLRPEARGLVSGMWGQRDGRQQTSRMWGAKRTIRSSCAVGIFSISASVFCNAHEVSGVSGLKIFGVEPCSWREGGWGAGRM